QGAGFELPTELRAAAEFTIGRRFEHELLKLEQADPSAYPQALEIAEEVARHGYHIDRASVQQRLEATQMLAVERAVAQPVEVNYQSALALFTLSQQLQLDANLERAKEIAYPTVPAQALEHLFSLTHPDPHSILGAHPTPLGVMVRAYRPEAASVEVIVEGEAPRLMTKAHALGLFELLLADKPHTFPYQLRIVYPNGQDFTLRDPYAFLPTLGDFDEYLFGEGKHLKLYEKLGAHVRRLGDVAGVSFAVWAPAAEGVSVVGSFNNWDGRL